MFDDIYQACVDYMAAYESGTETDESVERLTDAIQQATGSARVDNVTRGGNDVGQVDREEAAAIYLFFCDATVRQYANEIRLGRVDAHPAVQAFTRHRIASRVATKAAMRAEAVRGL